MASNGTFSYAQAAKGLAPSTQANSTVPSSASSEHGGRDESATSKAQPTQSVQDSDQRKGSSSAIVLAQAADVEGLKSTNGAAQDQSHSTTMSTAVSDTDSKTQPSLNTPEAAPVDKSTVAEAEAQNVDDDKAKDADEDWEKVSVPSMTAEKELKAAPPPPVNIWQQRKEAQEAKQKELAIQRVVPVPAPSKSRNSTSASADDTRRKASTRDLATDKDSTPVQRRVNSGSRASADRKEHHPAQVSPRSLSQQGPKPTAPPRPATDAESWPTPDTVSVDERRRSTVYEKTDKPDLKAGAQKKWVQMPFVPTAKFETQLPPAAARRGGRAGNRGRDGGGRGGGPTTGQHAVTEKSEAGAMGPPPLPNKPSEDRGRKNTGAQATRSSSVPTQSNHVPGTEDEARDTTRSSIAYARETTGHVTAAESTSQAGSPLASREANTNEEPRASSRHNNDLPSNRRRFDADVKDSPQAQPSGAPSTFDGTARPGSERYRSSAHDNPRASIDFSAQGREWSRGRSDAPRERSESWRGREPRSERGRGGYRGRGNHSGYSNNPSAHGFTAPLPQTGFDSSKSTTPHESRNRQVSYPSFPPSPSVSSRNNPRSQSIPMAVSGGTYYNPMPGFPQAMSPTDMSFGPYQGVMHGSIMPAMPYAEPLGSFALLSMIVTQLEYYFSIDNLCKDMFLRKNMDSQGYVPLSVITNFKRIKALTEGQMPAEQLRATCQQARNVEFVIGDDGEDKLRSRDNWRDFVLPMDERLPAAQNDGPTSRTTRQPTNGSLNGGNIRTTSNGYPEQYGQSMPPMGFPHIPSFDGSADFQPSHTDSQITDQTRRVSTTSPLSKVQSPSKPEHARSPSGYMPNGHHHSLSNAGAQDNMFPDDKISELKVVVRDPTFESNPEYPLEAGPLGLRGGAGSVEHLEHFRNSQFGRAQSLQSPHDSEQPSYFTRDGQIGQIPTGPGFVHEEYLPLHEKAVSQRSENHLSGALLVLYAFWSSFLVENFNLSMYEEFSVWANEDLQAGNENGKIYLLKYYEKLLTSKLATSDRIANDIVILARKETGEHRPTWQKLRSAWRNGATNLKTRKRLADVLTVEEKTELDKSV